MPHLDVVALITAKPGSEGPVREALLQLAAASREEEGCNGYELHASVADPNTFVTIERWRSQADLDAHMQQPHLAAAMQAAGEHLVGAPAIHPLAPVA